MSNIIPERGYNFKVYLNGTDMLGIAEANFPSLEFITAEVKGGGIAGTIDAPNVGQLSSMTISLTWRIMQKDIIKLATPDVLNMEMWEDTESYNAGLGKIKHGSVYAFMRARTKKVDLGKLVVGDAMDTQTEHEIYYLKLSLDNKEVLEVDKYNYIYKVNGIDYMAEVRRNLGM